MEKTNVSSRKSALRIALVAVLTAVVVVFTYMRVLTMKGYINLGDVIIYFAAYLFGPWVAAIAGGLGTGLTDLIVGFPQWAPLSFLIHGAQGLLVALIARAPVTAGVRGDASFIRKVLGGVLGIIVMAGGYYIAGGILFGFEPALVEVPLNLLQGGVGMVLGIIVSKTVQKAYPPVRSLYW